MSPEPGTPTREEQLLIEEYKNAAQLTYHVDNLRDRLTVFFVTAVGIAAAGLAVVLKNTPSALALEMVASLFLLVSVLGVVVTLIVARLRSVQIEHFRILSNIRTYFYGDDVVLWATVELGPHTVPAATRTSGSYMWFACIMVVTAFAAGVGTYLLVHEANPWLRGSYSLELAPAVGLAWALLLDWLYIRRAQPPDARPYPGA